MKNKVIGILVFLFFVAVPFLLEDGSMLKLLAPSPILIVFGPAIGLTVAHFRKGMDRQIVLKKLKKYLIVSGLLGTLLGFISVLGLTPTDMMTAVNILRKLSSCLIAAFYGLLTAYIVDTFIEEK